MRANYEVLLISSNDFPQHLSTSKKLGSLNEEESPRERTWTPPTSKQHIEEEKENRPLRPKSPSMCTIQKLK